MGPLLPWRRSSLFAALLFCLGAPLSDQRQISSYDVGRHRVCRRSTGGERGHVSAVPSMPWCPAATHLSRITWEDATEFGRRRIKTMQQKNDAAEKHLSRAAERHRESEGHISFASSHVNAASPAGAGIVGEDSRCESGRRAFNAEKDGDPPRSQQTSSSYSSSSSLAESNKKKKRLGTRKLSERRTEFIMKLVCERVQEKLQPSALSLFSERSHSKPLWFSRAEQLFCSATLQVSKKYLLTCLCIWWSLQNSLVELCSNCSPFAARQLGRIQDCHLAPTGGEGMPHVLLKCDDSGSRRAAALARFDVLLFRALMGEDCAVVSRRSHSALDCYLHRQLASSFM
ncbi:hypothetical protein Q8A73_011231 [Channa argus]|nr:hypothetical protein Q8A73_011231 [Channa argus]